MSVSGGLQIAARRTISNCGAYTIGLACGTDVHKKTIVKYEVKLREARIASFRAWQRANYAMLADPGDGGDDGQTSRGLRFVLNRLRFDASRINLYKRCKLNVSEVRSLFVTTTITNGMSVADADKFVDDRKMMGTLLKSKFGDARGNLALVEKQFDSIRVVH